jgi:hypothetical protein
MRSNDVAAEALQGSDLGAGWVGRDDVISTWPLDRLCRFLAKDR